VHLDWFRGLVGHIERLSPQLHVGTAYNRYFSRSLVLHKEIIASTAGHSHIKKKV
jgi:hypothetical protein